VIRSELSGHVAGELREANVKHSRSILLLGLFACSVTACQGEVSLGNNDLAVKPGSNQPKGQSCKQKDQGWTELLRGAWSLAPGEEAFYCAKTTVVEDTYLRAARGAHALGTHDAVLSFGDSTGPDGFDLCTEELSGRTAITTSPAGTHEVEAAEGAAVLVSRGQQIVLRLHVFNTSPLVLEGESIQEVKQAPASSITVVRDTLDLGLLPQHALEVPAQATCEPHADLISHDFEIAPGSEEELCLLQTVSEDVTFTDIEALTPPGTHSVVMSAGEPIGPDGLVPSPGCDFAEHVIFGATAGSHRLTAPDGFGVRVPAGLQLRLNLHVVNVTAAQLRGTAGFRVR
jgi:hypothetical protein